MGADYTHHAAYTGRRLMEGVGGDWMAEDVQTEETGRLGSSQRRCTVHYFTEVAGLIYSRCTHGMEDWLDKKVTSSVTKGSRIESK